MKCTIVNDVKRSIENYVLQIQIGYLECLISANIKEYRSYSYLFKICKKVFKKSQSLDTIYVLQKNNLFICI